MKNILIADDDTNLALLYEQELSDEGYQVQVVHDARAAIERVQQNPPDLLVLDIRMPGMDGIEALNKILGINNQLPVILNTAYSNHKDNYLTWSADAYVVKSSDLTELKDAIQNILAKKSEGE
ncbi:MAG: response regulator [Candidatus Latescibacteria bacterium]|jgi:CheY-like chemotaxis protein|nr:response regulator [Candidatus Latescibacterota bacterium]MBT5832357.1 response regulator [Candidatus Latescibacterota bacterium]